MKQSEPTAAPTAGAELDVVYDWLMNDFDALPLGDDFDAYRWWFDAGIAHARTSGTPSALELAAAEFAPERPAIEHDGLKMVAHHTGDGWALGVETADGEVLGYLEWPKTWPESMSVGTLQRYGFEIV